MIIYSQGKKLKYLSLLRLYKKGVVIMKELHESLNGIYVGDYKLHLELNKGIDVFEEIGNSMSVKTYKLKDLESILNYGFSKFDKILISFCFGDYKRRINKINKLELNIVQQSKIENLELHDNVYVVVTRY